MKYIYKFQMCGNCCRQPWDIILTVRDILKWDQEGKIEFLKHIQINPLSISPAGLGDPRFGVSQIELPLLKFSESEAGDKKFDKENFEENVSRIKDFVLSNHIYIGEGSIISPTHSYFCFFFPVNTYFPGVGDRPIFTPINYK